VAWRSMTYALAAGVLCAAILVAILLWPPDEPPVPERPEEAPDGPAAEIDQEFPEDIQWQGPADSGEHPLLGVLDAVALREGGSSTDSISAELEAVIRAVATAQRTADKLAPLKIDYPLNGTVFPPEIVAPTFLWHESAPEADTWLIEVAPSGTAKPIYVLSAGRPPAAGEMDPACRRLAEESGQVYERPPYQQSARTWQPDGRLWAAMKESSVERAATVTVVGFASSRPRQPLSRGRMTFATSADPVAAPIFYRDVPLLPSEGEKGVIKPLSDTAFAMITWRLRDISQPRSRVVLKDMPTCANCHSFSRDGNTLGMDVDGPSGDKGAYAIVPISPRMKIAPEDVITWNSFPQKPPGTKTIGFLSQVSPDGQYVITTVNESIYVVNFLDFRFLQVFYPTRGILAYYSREDDQMKALPGADDPDYVHCAPTWTPDGKYLVFCRAKAKDPYVEGQQEPQCANDPAELPMQYDLYRIPFNGGRGGRCEPIRGASDNGMSNTFPKVSPDGKWIVFVKCRNGQLMRPDGKLWIVPVEGGPARLMRCNTWRMNSWHSFSPNGRWMVFSSKANTPYTQMFLTHIDADGNDSPPVLIPHATAANRAVNIPEFVNIDYERMVTIDAPAVEYFRHYNQGRELARTGRHQQAVAMFRKALEGEPDDWRINAKLAESLAALGEHETALRHFRKALARNPNRPMLYNKTALALIAVRDFRAALQHFTMAVRLDPELALAWCNRGNLRLQLGDRTGARQDFDAALRADPKLARAWFGRGNLRHASADTAGALADYDRAIELDPKLTIAWLNRANLRVQTGDVPGARSDYDAAIRLAPTSAVIWFNRGNLRVATGDADGAAADYTEAIRLDPKLVAARANRGNLRMARGDYRGAREDFDVALQLDPKDPGAWCNRGLVCKLQGDWSGAVRDLSKCLELAPADWPHRPRMEEELRRARAKIGQRQ